MHHVSGEILQKCQRSDIKIDINRHNTNNLENLEYSVHFEQALCSLGTISYGSMLPQSFVYVVGPVADDR